MPTIDQKYIERLDSFTNALEGIVELLKQSVQKNNVDNVNELLSNMNDDIKGIVKNVEIIAKTTKKIESQTDKILEEIKASRKAKETGMFGEISEVDNKKKILDAVKVIVLIAGGILAIGMAFKLIAPVNFLSVIAIGLSIVFITGAFVAISALTENLQENQFNKTTGLLMKMALIMTASSWILAMASTISLAKSMSIIFVTAALSTSLYLLTMFIKKTNLEPSDYKKMLLIPLILPVISLTIAISSGILSNVVPLSLTKILTSVFVAGAIGAILYGLMKSTSDMKIEPKDVSKYLLFPIIIPAIAGGLVLSSIILSNIKELSLMQMVSSVFTAVTIGVLVYLMKPMIEKMQDLTLESVALAGLLVASLTLGLVGASRILGLMKTFSLKESLSILLTSAAIGLTVLFLVPAVKLLKDIKINEALQASANIILLSGAISLSSIILSIGMYNNYPGFIWAIGVGLTITILSGTIWLMKKMNLKDKDILFGSLAILSISTTIMLSSWILNMGKYENYPRLNWLINVGLSLLSFGGSMIALGILANKFKRISQFLLTGALLTLSVATTIMLTSWIINLGNYEYYPTFNWAIGTGMALVAFGGGMILLGKISKNPASLLIGALLSLVVATTMAAASWIISLGNYDQYPTLDWASGVGLSILALGGVAVALGLLVATGVGAIGIALGLVSMLAITSSIVAISLILSSGDYTNGPPLEWAKSTSGLLLTFGATSILMGVTFPFVYLGMMAMKKVAQSIVDVAEILADGNYTGGPSEKWSKEVGLSIKTFAEGLLALNRSGGFISSLFGIDQTNKIRQIAQAMVDASHILQEGQWTSYPPAEWSKGVGDTVLQFAKAMAALDDADIDNDIEFIGMIRTISRGLIESAKILNEFDWKNIENYPTEEWSRGVGLAINAFAKPLSDMAEFGVKGNRILKGIESLTTGIIETAKAFDKYPWDKLDSSSYPSSSWISGVEKSITMISKVLIDLEKSDVERRDIKTIDKIVNSIIQTARSFNLVKDDVWNKGPKLSWAENIGKILNVFIKNLSEIEKSDIGKSETKNLNRIVDAIKYVANKFSSIKDGAWSKGPTIDWAKRMGNIIGTFVKILIDIESNDIIKKDVFVLNKVIDTIIRTATIFSLSESIMPKIWKSYPTKEWVEGVRNSLNIFTKSLVELGKNDITKKESKIIDSIVDIMGKTAIKFGLLEKLSSNIWNYGPTERWARTIPNVIKSFTDGIIKISNVNGDKIELFKSVIDLINWTATKFKIAYNYDNKIWTYGPDEKWSKNVPNIIKQFSDGIINLSNINEDKFKLFENVVDIITSIADKFKKIQSSDPDIWKYGPTEEWSKGMSSSISAYVGILNLVSNVKNNDIDDLIKSMSTLAKSLKESFSDKDLFGEKGTFNNFSDSISKLTQNLSKSKDLSNGLNLLVDSLNSINTIGFSSTDSIKSLTKSIIDMSNALNEVNVESIDKLSKFSNGMLVLSLIDEKKFEEAISIIDKKKNDIISILSENETIKSKKSYGETTIDNSTQTSNKTEFYDKLLSHVRNLDTNVVKILEKKDNKVVNTQYNQQEDVLSDPNKFNE